MLQVRQEWQGGLVLWEVLVPLDLKGTEVTKGPRGPEVFRAQLVSQAKQEKGVVMERMELVGCQENQGLRVTVGLTASPGFQERKAIEVTKVLQALQDLREKMEEEEKTAQLDREV